MATIREVLDRAQAARPDAWPEELKAKWIMDLNREIWHEVILRHETAAGETLPETLPDTFPEDQEETLLIPAPWDDIYDLYLYAQADLMNREAGSYGVSSAAYAQRMGEWRRQYHRTHMPKTPQRGGACCCDAGNGPLG